MLYKLTNWANGDKITADKLNKIELGLEKVKNQKPLIVKFIQVGEYAFVSDIKIVQIVEAWNKGQVIYFDYSTITGELTFSIVNPDGSAMLAVTPSYKNITSEIYSTDDGYVSIEYPNVQ